MKKMIFALFFTIFTQFTSLAQGLSHTAIFFDWDNTVFKMFNNDFWRMKDPANSQKNYFLEDVEESVKKEGTIVEGIKYDFRGPSFISFQQAMNNEKFSEVSFILTARGHHPLKIYKGLEYLKSLGLIKNIVPLKNIIPVNHESIRQNYPDAMRGDQIKAAILQQRVLDIKKEINFLDNEYKVIFFDDDVKNVKSTVAAFSELEIEKNIDMLIIYRNIKRSPRDKLPEYLKLLNIGENQSLVKAEMNEFLYCPAFCL